MEIVKALIKIYIFAVIGLVMAIYVSCSSTSSVSSQPVLSPVGTATTFILVRHAERAKEQGESALRSEGRERAQALVTALGEMEITAIYCPDRGRNRETAQPLADHLGMKVNLVAEKRLTNTRKFAADWVQECMSKHAGGMIVWIGNKSPVGIWGGNLQEIYKQLGGTGDAPSRYDDLFIIKIPDKGVAKVIKKTYGQPAGRFDQ
jgi:hypothetical protein